MEACSLLVNLRKGMQRSSEQPLVGEERYMTTLITAAKETTGRPAGVGFLIYSQKAKRKCCSIGRALIFKGPST